MEEERTREELVNEINELALAEATDLVELPEQDGGSADMLIGVAIGTGITALFAGGAWLWRNRHKRKKAKMAAQKKKETEEDVEWRTLDDEDNDSEPEEEVKPEKDK